MSRDEKVRTCFERELVVLGTLVVIQGFHCDVQIVGRIRRVIIAVIMIACTLLVGFVLVSRVVIVIIVFAKRIRFDRRSTICTVACLMLIVVVIVVVRRPFSSKLIRICCFIQICFELI